MKQFISKAVKILFPYIAFYLQDIWADSARKVIRAEEFDCFLTAVKDMEFVTWSNFFLFVASILHNCSTGGGSDLRYFAPHPLQDFMTPSGVLIQLCGLVLNQKSETSHFKSKTHYIFLFISVDHFRKCRL